MAINMIIQGYTKKQTPSLPYPAARCFCTRFKILIFVLVQNIQNPNQNQNSSKILIQLYKVRPEPTRHPILPHGRFWWDELTTNNNKWLLFGISFSAYDLSWPSDNLVATCESQGWPWQHWSRPVDDPDDNWWGPVDDPLWLHWQLLWWQFPLITQKCT